MAAKRSAADLDPDYDHDNVSDHQAKRQRLQEQDAKNASVKKIESIIRTQFKVEMENKEAELNMVDQRLHQARSMMDRLRAVVVASYYSRLQQVPGRVQVDSLAPPPSIHPAVKKHLGKAPVSTMVKNEPFASETSACGVDGRQKGSEAFAEKDASTLGFLGSSAVDTSAPIVPSTFQPSGTRGFRFTTKKKIVVGNVSKFIPINQREQNDRSTHKWMVYVRGPRESPRIDDFVSKVWFFLHPSYRPNDLVEVSTPPFHLTRRGWGEFPVRVQLHFKDSRNKRVDIIHQLKLDKSCTGLQTLGAETVVEIELYKDLPFMSRPPIPSSFLSRGTAVKSEPAGQDYSMKRPADVSQQHKDSLIQTADNDSTLQERMAGMCTCVSHNEQEGKCLCRNLVSSSAVKRTVGGSAEAVADQEGKLQNITIKEEPPDKFVDIGNTQPPVSSVSQGRSVETHQIGTSNHNASLHGNSGSHEKSVSDKLHCSGNKRESACAAAGQQDTGDGPISISVLSTQTSTVPATHASAVVQLAYPASVSHSTGAVSSANVGTLLSKPGTKVVSLLHGKKGISLLPAATGESRGASGDSSDLPGRIVKDVHWVTLPSGKVVLQMENRAKISASVTSSNQGGHSVTLSTAGGHGSSSVNMTVASATGGNNGKPLTTTANPVLLQVTAQGLKAVPVIPSYTTTSSAATTGANVNTYSRIAAATVSSSTVPAKPVITSGSGTPPKMVSLLKTQHGPLKLVPSSFASVSGAISLSASSSKLPAAASSSGSTQPRMVSLLGKVPITTPSQVVGAQPAVVTLPRRVNLAMQAQSVASEQSRNVSDGHASVTPTSAHPVVDMSSSSLLQAISLLGQASPVRTSAQSVAHPGAASLGTASPLTAAVQSSGALRTVSLLSTQSSMASGKPAEKHQPLPVGQLQIVQNRGISPLVVSPAQVRAQVTDKEEKKVSLLASVGGKTVLMTLDAPENKPVLSLESAQNGPGRVSAVTTQMSLSCTDFGPFCERNLMAENTSTTGRDIYGCQIFDTQKSAKILSKQHSKPQCNTISMGAELAKLKAANLASKQFTQCSVSSHQKPHTAKWFSKGLSGDTTVLSQDGGVLTSSPVRLEDPCQQKPVEKMEFEASTRKPEPDKKIMVTKPKKLRAAEEEPVGPSPIHTPGPPALSLSINSYPDMQSLVRAAVLRHPLIDADADKYTSPYCAKSLEQWLSWKTGKQRASEWMRAVTVRKCLHAHLKDEGLFKGEPLWTTKHIMQWCRLHGLSPHGPGGGLIGSDTRANSCEEEAMTSRSFSSRSSASLLLSHFTSADDQVDSDGDDSEEIDIVSEDPPVKTAVKKEVDTVDGDVTHNTEVLLPTPEAIFIQETVAKLRVKMLPHELEPGVLASTAEDMMFAAMLEFAGDILQEAVAAMFSSKRTSATLTPEHVYQALCSFPAADFLTNKYCGVEDQSSPTKR